MRHGRREPGRKGGDAETESDKKAVAHAEPGGERVNLAGP
jgi:hypothetical protein